MIERTILYINGDHGFFNFKIEVVLSKYKYLGMMNKYSYLHDPKKATIHINDIDATDFILNFYLYTDEL